MSQGGQYCLRNKFVPLTYKRWNQIVQEITAFAQLLKAAREEKTFPKMRFQDSQENNPGLRKWNRGCIQAPHPR